MMNDVKQANLGHWTQFVPGLRPEDLDRAGTGEFYKEVDEFRYANEPYLAAMLDDLVRESEVLLEVGFGLGTDLRRFARRGVKVTGLDYSPENAYLAELGFETCGLEGRALAGDAESLPFPDGSFDVVYSWGCLHHTPDTPRTIDEVFRVLRPGGRTMIMLYRKGYQYVYLLMTYLMRFRWLTMSLQDHISAEYDRAPLSQMFSKSEIRAIFHRYENVRIDVVTFGGIQYHPVLKYLWKVFNAVPPLMRLFGSFAVISAQKPGSATACGSAPAPCCPVCHSDLHENDEGARCSNPSCGRTFRRHKECVLALHPGDG